VFGRHLATGREIAVLRLDSAKTPFGWDDRKGQHFVCLCIMDARSASTGELGNFCSSLLRIGCAYFCGWGPDCERVHDVMDAQVLGESPPRTYIGLVMTTWHPKDTLRGAFDYFLDCTIPDEEFAPDGCTSALIIVAGSDDWAEAIESLVKETTVPIGH
jgi:hypothetical protein